MSFEKEKKELVYWAHLLNQRGFVTARSGNISCRLGDNKALITSHDCYLGFLEEKDLLIVDLAGNSVTDKAKITVEQALHLGIYKKFPKIKVALHAHPAYTTAFFYYFDKLESFSYETKFYLGQVKAIAQETPTVTETTPVLAALENNNIVVLKNHGVVAMGQGPREAFSLIELLEEQAKVNLILKSGSINSTNEAESRKPAASSSGRSQSYKMLSSDHAQALMEVVNNDQEVQELGKKYDLTCTLAVKNIETAQVMCFYYEKGRITKIDNNEDAEFVIIGKEGVLKKVFNREIDPFVASTQGKVKTKGDFAKMSRWYPVMVRTFKLWEEAPVY